MWSARGGAPEVCVNTNSREMTLAYVGQCPFKGTGLAQPTSTKEILACADKDSGVLRWPRTGVCWWDNTPVKWLAAPATGGLPGDAGKSSSTTTTVPTTTSTGTSGASGTAVAVVLPVEVPGLISVCVNKSTSVLRDTADNSCSSGSEVKVEWLDTGMSPKICVNNNNREMTLAQDGKCTTKRSALADVTANKQILACADDKTGVLRYRASGVCGTKTDPVTWVLKDQGVARNVDSGVKQGVLEIISLIPTAAGAGSTKTVTTSPATNTSSATTTATTTTTTTTIAVTTTVPTATTSTTTIVARASGSFAGYFGGTCPDGSGIPWYWGSDSTARAGGCSAAASIAPTTTAPATTTTAVSATTVAPVVVPGTPGTPTGVAGNTQVTVSVTAGTGGSPTSYTVTKSTDGVTYSTGCTVTVPASSCVVTGLTNGTAYTFKTTATNSAGTSAASAASAAVTPVTVPGAPTIGAVAVASATSVTVNCTTPASNGGATITSYTATAVGDATKIGTLTSATCGLITVTGLTTNTAYTFTVTATNAAGTSVASAASAAVTPAFIVGNTGPGGGIVFYVQAGGGTFACGATLASTCKYLEAAPTTGTNAWTDATYVWSGNTTVAIGANAQGTAVGSGYKNTEAMVTNNNTANRAGTIARAYRGPNNLSDWYLPSKDELHQLYTQKTTVGGFSTDIYWSSSEIDDTNAWYQNFGSGFQGPNLKHGPIYVRPVRAFG